MKNISLAFLATIALTAPAFAQDHTHAHHAPASNDLYAPSRDAMHKDMNVAPSGNADVDFVKNMIPHHEGAVAMAKVQLEHGKDPELRKLAEDIIKAQDKEIAQMKDWLKKNEKK